MKEKIISLVGNKLDELRIFVDDVYTKKEGNMVTMYIVLDTNENKLIDLDTVVKATEILNKIVDDNHFDKDIDVLDIYAKEKGDV